MHDAARNPCAVVTLLTTSTPTNKEKFVDAFPQSAVAWMVQTAMVELVVFTLHGQSFALRLGAVERIVRVAQITSLPSAPAIVLGVVNIQGRVVPVVDLCKRFGLPARDIELSDHLIVARTLRRPVALLVAAVKGVIDCLPSQLAPGGDSLPDTQYVEGVLKLEDGLVLIHDLDTFLSPMEDRKLAQALACV